MNLDDTIVAIATPPGRGGIGVVRLAGAESKAIAQPMLRLKHELEPGRAVFGELIEPCGAGTPARETTGQESRSNPENNLSTAGMSTDPAEAAATDQLIENSRTGVSATHGQRLDEIVVTYFAKPHSYTTDDVIEISAHGSPVLLRHIVEMCVARGARVAEPGEFTMRAFLNGRIDLTQAEAVRDLIDSQTLYQAKVASQQLGGALSHRLQPIKQRLVELIAVLEAGIDFAEDDVSVLPAKQILPRIHEIRVPLIALAESFHYGKIVHEGLTLAIVGRPNVGKSSLFNRLVERERAIVTATPGTTRDLVTETVSIGGIPVKLVDTAGIRHALDEAELIGIRKSMEALADADLVLLVLDSSQPVCQEDRDLLDQVNVRSGIVVANKCDLNGNAANLLPDRNALRASAMTSEGIGELRAEILKLVGGENGIQTESGFLTSVRHQQNVQQATAALDAAKTAVESAVPHEMLLMDLYNSLHALDEITGATTNDDILNLIFSTFCIGK